MPPRTCRTARRASLLVGVVLLGTGPGLSGQDPGWEAFLATWRKASHLPVTLLAPGAWADARPWSTDETLLQLIVGGDVEVLALEGGRLDQIRAAREWGASPRWLALGRDGEVLGESATAPDGAQVKAWLLGTGLPATWDEQERFLRLHPEHGTTLSLRLFRSLRMARLRFRALEQAGAAEGVRLVPGTRWPQLTPARILDSTSAAGWDREVAETLTRISRLPDAWRLGDELWLRSWLNFYGPVAGPDLQEGLPAFRDALLAAWRRYPDSGGREVLPAPSARVMDGFVGLWMACSRCLSGQAERVPEVPDLAVGPGHVWPDAGLFRALASTASSSGRWDELLQALDRCPEPGLAGISSSQGWVEALDAQREAIFWRGVALAELGRWPEAVAALRALRESAGSGWEGMRGPLKAFYGADRKSARERTEPRPEPVEQAFLAVLDLPALPNVKPPALVPPLRFLVWGTPAWTKDWPTIRATGDLATYAPEELRKEEPTPADRDRMAAAGLPVRGWAVFRGTTDILARGQDAPEPARLALQLQGASPSRIAGLDAFLRRHPDQLDARKDRYDLIRARMPLPALEARMREDAATAQLPLDFGPDAPWISDLDAWRAAARQVVPEVQAALARWPDRSFLWRAWVSWSAFLPQPPSVLGLAQSLPVLGPRARWAADLPAEVHRAVVRQGLEAGRIQELLDWFEAIWAEVRTRTWERGIPKANRDQERAIFEAYRDALRAAGRPGDRADQEKAWASHVSRYGKPAVR